MPVDIAHTVPKHSLIESFVASTLSRRPVFGGEAVRASHATNMKADAGNARTLRNDMMKEYLTQKQQLGQI